MKKLAAWLAEQRASRILTIAALFPFGLLGLVSAAVVVMTAILRGWRTALEDSVAALALLALVWLATGGNWQALLFSALPTLGSALLLGSLAGRYGSLTLSLQVLVLLAASGVLLFGVLVEDPVAFWRPLLEMMAGQMSELGLPMVDPAALEVLAPMMTGLAAASAVISSTIGLVIGAWMASAARGVGFARMFLGIRMGAVLGLLAAVAGVATLFGFHWLPASLLLVFGSGFAVQGIAVLHWRARAHRWPWPVLLAIYLPLLFGPVVVAVAWLGFAGLGFVDNWYNLRRGGVDVIK